MEKCLECNEIFYRESERLNHRCPIQTDDVERLKEIIKRQQEEIEILKKCVDGIE
jgi:hypothetical protein